ncbi:MAG: (2Fe-2S)-binding protein [Gemmatimonadaceae bacterium]|nr:(2Fe-2S)-binding protein [Gemmatimonadaceae bacterium]
MPIAFSVNGTPRESGDAPETPLLWVLRDTLGLTGTKYGCGIAQCGACTVHIDGQAQRSCAVPVSTVQGKDVVTIEALSADPRGKALQEAWVAHQVPQCGYCQSGFLMAATDLLKATPQPTDAQIERALTNICRCGTQPRMKAAIRDAAAAIAGGAA